MFADDRAPGDLGFDPLGCGKDPQAFARRQLVEVKNGRLAMIAFGGMIHQQLLTKQGVIEQVKCVSVLLFRIVLLPACWYFYDRSFLQDPFFMSECFFLLFGFDVVNIRTFLSTVFLSRICPWC